MIGEEPVPRIFFIFSGRGVDDATTLESVKRVASTKPGITVQTITADELLSLGELDPREICGFMLPGGAGPQYDQSIGKAGFDILREYVENGGVFYGICAGAYYASRELEWRPDHGPHKFKTPGLDFFNGLASGPEPALMANSHPAGGWKDACVVTFESHSLKSPASKRKQQGQALYWDGPVLFSRDHYQNTEIMAEIILNESRIPAILKIRHGQGMAILSTIHPEISARQIGAYVDHDPELAERVTNRLKKTESIREQLWEDCLDCAFIPSGLSLIQSKKPRSSCKVASSRFPDRRPAEMMPRLP